MCGRQTNQRTNINLSQVWLISTREGNNFDGLATQHSPFNQFFPSTSFSFPPHPSLSLHILFLPFTSFSFPSHPFPSLHILLFNPPHSSPSLRRHILLPHNPSFSLNPPSFIHRTLLPSMHIDFTNDNFPKILSTSIHNFLRSLPYNSIHFPLLYFFLYL